MIALDLFAGTGWGVACQRLGIEEYGVEIMPEARATREANGMTTIYSDVWNGLAPGRVEAIATEAAYDLLIASPPCQTFSMAGGGAGRRALDDVLGLIDTKAYRDIAKLRDFGETHDPRTALVLTPLAHVYRDTPTYVVLEQVPPVLPVWERCAKEMRAWGYSVWVGVVNAEQYGVPQTRKRAILIARADGVEAIEPPPSHSRYYPRDPTRLDPGVAPWVSMAEALGWNIRPGEVTMRSSFGTPKTRHEDGSRAGGHHTFDPATSPSHTVTGIVTGWKVNLDPNLPATTVAADPRLSSRDHHEHGAQAARSTRVTLEEAAALQSYPPDFVWDAEIVDPRSGKLKPITKTKKFLQVGNAVPPLLAEAILRAATGRES